MKIDRIAPVKKFLIVKKEVDDAETASGFQVEENSDDFLVHGIVVHGTADFVPGTDVVFEAVYAQALRDGADEYLVIHEDDIIATYDPENVIS